MPIFDQGYQHWRGPLSGHPWRWLTIARQGVRVQGKNRILRILLLLAWLPAIGLVLAVVLWGLLEQKSAGLTAWVRDILPPGVLDDPHAYRATVWTLIYSYFFKTEMFFIMLLVAAAGPGLISQDLRFNALPLYFARPLNRLDYFLGKLGVIGALVASVAVGPAVFAYFVGVCFSLDLSVVKDTYPVLLASVAYGLVITLSAGTLILALSSLTRRSLYVGITWAGLWIISGMTATLLTAIHGDSVRREAQVAQMNRWIDDHPPPPGARMQVMPSSERYPILEADAKTRKTHLAGLRPEQQQEGERWFNDWARAQAQAWEKAEAEQSAALRGDWRPMCSYVANLERIADLLLNTEAAWVSIGKAEEQLQAVGRAFDPRARRRAEVAARQAEAEAARGMSGPRAEQPPRNERRRADEHVLQYPWWWSAGVLAALLGLSAWTLTRRVKSLDRLK
jgi:hypothetical protein